MILKEFSSPNTVCTVVECATAHTTPIRRVYLSDLQIMHELRRRAAIVSRRRATSRPRLSLTRRPLIVQHVVHAGNPDLPLAALHAVVRRFVTHPILILRLRRVSDVLAPVVAGLRGMTLRVRRAGRVHAVVIALCPCFKGVVLRVISDTAVVGVPVGVRRFVACNNRFVGVAAGRSINMAAEVSAERARETLRASSTLARYLFRALRRRGDVRSLKEGGRRAAVSFALEIDEYRPRGPLRRGAVRAGGHHMTGYDGLGRMGLGGGLGGDSPVCRGSNPRSRRSAARSTTACSA